MLAEPGKSPDESLNPDSESTLKKSGFVTRNPISIFSLIKNAKDEEGKKKLNQLLETLRKKLPEGFKIGAAVGEGDCFFDSVAQGLNELKDKGLITDSKGFSVKSLRENCKQYAQQVDRSKEDPWLGSALKKESEKLCEYIPRIEFTAEDIENTSSSSEIKILKLESAIWGRPEIEGKMICEKYGVKIRIIELRDEEIDGLHVTEGKIGTGENVIYIVNYRNHFVSLLSSIQQDIERNQNVNREEVYGIKNKSVIPLKSTKNSLYERSGTSQRSPGKENTPPQGSVKQSLYSNGSSCVFFYDKFKDSDLGNDESPLRKKFNSIIKDLKENKLTHQGSIKLISSKGGIKYLRAKLSGKDRLLFTQVKYNNEDVFCYVRSSSGS